MAKGVKTGGRQKGTPNKSTAEVKAIAGKYGPAAIKKAAELAGLITGKPHAESEAARIAAINTILDRAYGKATQPIAGDDDAPLRMVHEILIRGVRSQPHD
jgi:hypothetical protein